MERCCDECGRWVEKNELLYHVRMEVFAEPKLEFPDPGDLDKMRDDWLELVKAMEAMNEDQVREAEDQVYEKIEFRLCRECRSELHRRIRRQKEVGEKEE